MTHVMFDLETWGTKPGSALRSIGAVVFDPKSLDTGDTFYANINNDSCLDRGLTMDINTVKWWTRQSADARTVLEEDQRALDEVVSAFAGWWNTVHGEYVWSQGANFDVPLWEAACMACKGTTPWKFWNARDTRTAYAMANLNPKGYRFKGTPHNALDDAKRQAWLVQMAYGAIALRRGASHV